MKICKKCGASKDLTEFNYKKAKLNLKASVCKNCSREAVRKHYQKNRSYYLEKARSRNKTLRELHQEFLFDFLSKHPCVDCGEKDPVVLEFDHLRDKKNDVSEMVKLRYSRKRLTEEIEKCEVRCANCHRRKTSRDHHWYKQKNAPVA